MCAALAYFCLVLTEISASALHEAIYEGATIHELNSLQFPIGDIDVKNDKNLTALHVAVSANNFDACKFLLAAGINTEAVDDYGATPLIHAVVAGDLPIVKLLLKYGANANHRIRTNRRTALHVAAYQNHGEIFRTLLHEAPNVDVNAVDNAGWSSCQFAANEGHVDIVNMLPPMETKDLKDTAERKTSLHRAAIKGDWNMINKLLRLHISINERDANGATPIHYAAQHGHVKSLLALYISGASLEVKDNEGNTPLHRAVIPPSFHDYEEYARYGRRCARIVRVLLVLKANLSATNAEARTAEQLALHYRNYEAYVVLKTEKKVLSTGGKEGLPDLFYHIMIQKPKIQRIRELLEIYPNQTDHLGRPFLHYVVETNNIELARDVILAGYDPTMQDTTGNNVLHAVKSPEMAMVLLGKVPEAANTRNHIGNLPLHTQCEKQRLEVVRVLVKETADVKALNDQGRTPLDTATLKGDIPLAECLLRHDAGILLRTEWATPLHFAARRNIPEMMEIFLRRGFDPTAPDRVGDTPAHSAIANPSGNVDLLRLLLPRIQPDVVNKFGYTLLHYAVFSKSPNKDEMARFLLEYGVPINAKTYNGKTALIMTAVLGCATSMKILLEHGANTRVTSLGKSAMHAAVSFSFAECVELLTNADNGLLLMKDSDGKTPLDCLLGYNPRNANGKKVLEAMSLTGADIPEQSLKKALGLLSPSFLNFLEGLQAPLPFQEYLRRGIEDFKRDHVSAEIFSTFFHKTIIDMVKAYVTLGMGTFYSLAAAYYPQLAALKRPASAENFRAAKAQYRGYVEAFEIAREKLFYYKRLRFMTMKAFMKGRDKIIKGTYMDSLPEELIEDIIVAKANNGNILGKIELLSNSIMLALNKRSELPSHFDYIRGKIAQFSALIIKGVPKSVVQGKRKPA